MGKFKESLLEEIERDAQSIPQSDNPDPFTENAIARADVERKNLENKGIAQDIAERKRYATLIFWLISLWLFFISELLIIQGLFSVFNKTFLSDRIIITLLAGTTVKVLGLFLLVINYLFPKRPQ